MHRPSLRLTAVLVFASAIAMAVPSVARAAALYPAGIVSGASSTGVYASPNLAGCCWLSRRASFLVRVPARSDTLLLTVEIPSYALENAPAAFDVRVDGEPAAHLCCFDAGQHELVVHLAGAVSKTRTLRVHVRPSTFFVPAERGINQDTRQLTVLLQRVEMQNSRTGTQYLNGREIGASVASRATKILRVLLLLLGGIGTFLLARKRPAYAWVLLLGSAPFAFAIDTEGTTLSLPKAVLLGCLAASIPMWRQLRALRQPRFGMIAAAFGLFFLTSAISAVGAAQHRDAIRETLKILEYLVLFLLAFAYYKADPDETLLRRTLCWLLIVVSALAVMQLPFGVTEYKVFLGHTFPRIAGPLDGPNQLGAFLAAGIAIVYGFALVDECRTLARVALAIGLAALLLTFSKGGLLQCGAGLAAVYALRYRQVNRRAVAVAIGAVLLAAVAVTLAVAASPGFAPAHRFFGDPTNFNGGLGTRTGLWSAALQIWQHHPLFGIGPGNFEDVVGRFLPGVHTHPNSYFMELLAEQGLAGLLVFVWLTVAVLYALFKRATLPLCSATIAMVFGMALHQVYDGLLIYPKVGVFYWVLVGFAIAAASAPRSTTSVGIAAKRVVKA